MAVGKKSGGRDIVKGQVLNPNGRPKIPQDVKDARRMNRDDFTRVGTKLLKLTKRELKSKYEDPSTTMLELIVCKILQESNNKGDHLRLDFLLNRIIGPVPKALAVAIEPPNPNQGQSRVIMLPRNGREKDRNDIIDVDSKVIE